MAMTLLRGRYSLSLLFLEERERESCVKRQEVEDNEKPRRLGGLVSVGPGRGQSREIEGGVT